MPPTIRPGESNAEAALRWMTRILAALARQSKSGTITVSRKSMDAVSDTAERQALFEDRDNHGNLVLRFGSKHSAIYPVESDAKWDAPKETRVDRSQNSAIHPSARSSEPPSPSEPQVVPPKSDAKVAQLESTLRRQQMVNRIVAGKFREERAKRQSLEGMLEGLPEANERGGR